MKNLFSICMALLIGKFVAQVPVAGFSVAPNPLCSQNVINITDLSTNAPNAWSYTIAGMVPGPGGPVVLTVQNPTLNINFPGTYTVSLIATNSSGQSALVSQTIIVLASPAGAINPQSINSCPGGNPLTFSIQTFGPGGGQTYQWSTGSTTSSISVSPSVTTTYSCLITATNGCSVLRTATASIGQATVQINANPGVLFPGVSSTLGAVGLPTPGPYSYTWTLNSSGNVVANTRTLSVNTAGAYTLTMMNSNGCTATQTFALVSSTILPLTVLSTPPVLCAGNVATLQVTGAASYTWQTNATTANATVNPLVTTTYTVYGVLATCSGTGAITISVNVTPTITTNASPPVICSGATTTITASGATTYTWLQGGNLPTFTASPGTSTTYTVRGNNPGCPTRSAIVTVQTHPSPLINITSSSITVCPGEALALAASGALTYTWSTGDQGLVVLVHPTVTTTYSVTGNNQYCQGSAVITQSVLDCNFIGIRESEKQVTLGIFPNPNAGSFTVRSHENQTIMLFNQFGQQVLTIDLNVSNNRQVSVTGLPKGLYYLVEVAGNAQKIVVSH